MTEQTEITEKTETEDYLHGEEIHSPRIHRLSGCWRGGVVGWRFIDFSESRRQA